MIIASISSCPLIGLPHQITVISYELKYAQKWHKYPSLQVVTARSTHVIG